MKYIVPGYLWKNIPSSSAGFPPKQKIITNLNYVGKQKMVSHNLQKFYNLTQGTNAR